MSKRKFQLARLENECNLTHPTTRRNAKLSENKINSSTNLGKSEQSNKSKTDFQVKSESLIETNNENINPKKSKLCEPIFDANINPNVSQSNDNSHNNQLDIDYKSIFPEFIQKIYMNFVESRFYHDSLKKKDEFYAGVGLYGVGIEEKMYKQRKKMEESLKRGFRLRPNPKPTKRFDGTIINRPRRFENGITQKNVPNLAKSYLVRTKNRLNLFNIGRDSYRRKTKPVIRRNIKKKPSSISNRSRFSLKSKLNSKENNNDSNDESSSDIESKSIALTKPKRKLKIPQLEFKYCYETGPKAKRIVEMAKTDENQLNMKDIPEETEEERLETESVEIIKSDRCVNKVEACASSDDELELECAVVHKIDSDSSSVIEVVPLTKPSIVIHQELDNRNDLSENNGETSSDSLESSTKESPGLHKQKTNSSSNNSSTLPSNSVSKRKKPWRPKKALNLLDKLRLGLQCTIIQTENDIILQNLNTEDLGTLQSRIQGLTTFKNIEAEYDKNGLETARVTIDRKALNIPPKTYESSPEGKNSGLKRYFDSLKKKVKSKSVENLQIERKKPILSAKPLNISSGSCKSMDKSNNNSTASVLSHNNHHGHNFDRKLIEDQNSSQNWQRSKCRSIKKVRKLYTQSTNTPNILLRSCHNPTNSNPSSIKPTNTPDQSINSINYHHSHSILPLNYQNFRMSTTGNTLIDSIPSSNLIQSSSTIPSSTVLSNLSHITNPSMTSQTLTNVAFYPKLTKVASLPVVSSLPSLITNTCTFNTNIIKSSIENQKPESELPGNNLIKPTNFSNVDLQKIEQSSQLKDTEINTSNVASVDTSSSNNITVTQVSTVSNINNMSNDQDASVALRSTTGPATMTSVTMSSSISGHATPATALSASQLLMMKKGNGTTTTQNNIDNQHNQSSSPKNHYHNQYQHNHAAHHTQNYPNFQSHHNYSNSAAFLQQITSSANHNSITNQAGIISSNDHLITNQILKPFKLFLVLPQQGRGNPATKLIKYVPTIGGTNVILNKNTNNQNSGTSVQPAKIEIDDDENETDLDMPPHLSPQTVKSHSNESDNTPVKQNEDNSGVSTKETGVLNIIRPLIQSTSSSVQFPTSSKLTTVNTTSVISRQFQPISHVFSSAKQTPISAPTIIDSTTPNSSIKIKHRKLTHNFLSSSHTNFREVLCGSGSGLVQQNLIRTQPSSVIQFQTKVINKSANTLQSPCKSSSTVLKSLLVGSPTNTNANSNSSGSDSITCNNSASQNSNSLGNCMNNWAVKYLSNTTGLHQDNSKIKWQVSGSIKPTNYLENKNSNKDSNN